MSNEVVKKQLLVAITTLNLPLDSTPSTRKVNEACTAAKLLRNRLLREHARVTEFIENLRQKQIYDADSEGDDDEGFHEDADTNLHRSARTEFVFLAELMIVEKLVVPLLLTHGMKFSETLLPQLLKLLTAIMRPIPRFSANETLQRYLLKRIKARCGTDEFFALLVQSVAPIAEKRSAGHLEREDVVLLEVVLTLLTHLLDGRAQEVENIIGSFCRNHGIQLLVVVINQNYSKMQQRLSDENQSADDESERGEHAVVGGADFEVTVPGESQEQPPALVLQGPALLAESDAQHNSTNIPENEQVASNSLAPVQVQIIHDDTDDAEDDEEDEDEDEEDAYDEEEDEEELHVHESPADFEKQFKERVHNLLESEQQIWKWNCLAMKLIACVFSCVYPVELAQLSVLGQGNISSPDQLLNLVRGGNHFRECKNEVDSWRLIARSRNGSMSSNSMLVRLDPGNRPGTVGGVAIGTVSSLFGTRRKDPLENVKDIDLRKRGRFIKGMFQDSTSRCELPLPTKILLSQQSQSFLCFGFEPLNTMTWQRMQAISVNVERAAKEYKEMLSGFKNSGEQMEITSPLGSDIYQDFSNVLNYMTVCANLLHYIREVARLMKQDQAPLSAASFQQQWQSISSIISLDHLEGGFAVLRSFLQCRDLRQRCNVLDVVNYLAELLFMLNLILEKEVVDDVAADVAAHALASSVLYKEENIKTVFDLLNEYSSRNLSVPRSQSLTLFIFAVFQLMERCSYNGNLLLPKRQKRTANMAEAGDEGHQDDDEKASLNSAVLDDIEVEMANQMAGMINDESSSGSGSGSDEEARFPQKYRHSPEQQREAALGTAGAQQRSPDEAGQREGSPDSDEPEEQETGSRDHSSVRAASEARQPSVASMASSGRTALSTISSEREVAVSSYLRRLATPKNMGLLYSALRHWRINDADVNLGLTYLMEGLCKDSCKNAFFNIAFLLLFRDVIANGKRTHAPLFAVCDKLVYNFFNPSFARSLDYRIHSLIDEGDVNVLTGSQSFLGFEIALRCGRSLFNITASDYSVLEERAMPHMMEYTVASTQGNAADEDASAGALLPHELSDDENDRPLGVTEAMVRAERDKPQRKKRRRSAKAGSDNDDGGADSGKPDKKRRKDKAERREKKERKREKKEWKTAKLRGPQTLDAEPAATSAAAEEEDRMFQHLMATIAPAASAPTY